jgi:hypothetical protein
MMRRLRAVTALVGVLAVGPALVLPPAANAADPSNTSPSALRRCATTGELSARCLKGALDDFKRARAREGLGPMTLPTNFTALSIPAQLLVLADLDRVDRGLAPVAGLSSSLQPAAQAGAEQSRDPAFPAWTREGGSTWASTASSLWSEFLWMYDDGPGSGNVDCTTASDAGCYGHRHNILARYHGPILMGAGSDPRGGATQLFLGSDSHDSADLLTWAAERRLIPVGVSKHRLKRSGTLTVWASGRAMKVRAKASAGWHVSRSHCRLKAGHTCTVKVTGKGRGTLALKGPNGTVSVRLGR